uniref:Uncharacterized protein n=1 Tax=Anguilla anguilla TaxID=7936 RepID=A0A0E9T365_ANGAN
MHTHLRVRMGWSIPFFHYLYGYVWCSHVFMFELHFLKLESEALSLLL